MEIVFNDVSVVINKNTLLEKTLLSHVTFKIGKPLIYGFLGNSNSGKSIVADLINGIMKPTSGIVKINEFINNGKRIKNINKLRFDVGYVYKNSSDMFFNKIVKKELEFGMKYFKYKNNKITLRSEQSLKIVGLGKEYLNKNISDLSLSEAKKVSIASILVFNPKIIILDEPTIGLNYIEKKELMRILRLLKEKYNKTIILISKNVDFLYEIIDKVFIFNLSKLVRTGDVNLLTDGEMLKNYKLEMPEIAKFIEIAKKKGVKLEDYKDIKDLIKGVYRNVY